MSPELKPRVLVVDDEPQVRTLLSECLRPKAGSVSTAASADEAIRRLEAGGFDLVFSDMNMPGAGGMELLTLATQSHWDIGLILISGFPAVDQVVTALRRGVFDFLLKPIGLRDLHESLERNFQRLLLRRETLAYRKSLECSLKSRTFELESALGELETNYHATLDSLVLALDAREHETCAHSFRVSAYTTHLAKSIGYPAALMPQLEQAALLHDIGKIGIPDSILLKPGRLDELEFETMKEHTLIGQQMLSRIAFLSGAAKIVRHHHERFDGTGYPDRLAGDQIPLGSRIFAFADTLDAMTADRCYRVAPGFTAAREEVRRCTGTQFDPEIAAAFDRVKEEAWMALRLDVERKHGVAPPAAQAASEALAIAAA